MPSRKVISILIISIGLVASTILIFGDRKMTSTITGGLISNGPEVKLAQNTNWQADISSLSLEQKEVSNIQASSNKNVTEALTQSIVSNYLSLKQNGELDSNSANTLVDQAINYSEGQIGSTLKYKSSDILVLPDNSSTSIRNYGASLGTILKSSKNDPGDNETTIVKKMLTTKDKTYIEDLLRIQVAYENIVSSLSKTAVPSSFTNTHLELMNGIEGLANAVGIFTTVFDDPIKSVGAIELYNTSMASFIKAISKIRIDILNQGVVYKQGESGYYLYYGI